jgi:predicted transcriptional regulator
MKAIVDELVALVGGSGQGARAKSVRTATGTAATKKPVKMSSTRAVAVSRRREVDPHEVIPFDDGDFKDF